MQELVDRLQNKLRAFKRQIEEAEEIAALNLAKYRKTQVNNNNNNNNNQNNNGKNKNNKNNNSNHNNNNK